MERIILIPAGNKMTLRGTKKLEDLTPKELLLYAAGDCAGRTALQLLPKMRIDHTGFRIEVSGEVLAHNGYVGNVTEEFHLDGVPDNQTRKALSMLHKTFSKFCTVGSMMKSFTEVTPRYYINGTEYPAPEEE